MSVATLKRAIADNLYYIQGKNESLAAPHDYYMALAYTVRDRLIHRWLKTIETYFQQDAKLVFYLSAEFLMGRQLGHNLVNVGLWERAYQALTELGLKVPPEEAPAAALSKLNLYQLMEQEAEPGLGNGGLGRLAACFLDSMATVEIPRPDYLVEVKLGGHTEAYTDLRARYQVRWIPDRTVLGTPYDTLVPGYNTNTVNTLRLWSARASQDFDFQVFNAGDYNRAVAQKTFSENISKVLYPNDNTPQGKELRLEQQYFFVSCSLQDIIRLYLLR